MQAEKLRPGFYAENPLYIGKVSYYSNETCLQTKLFNFILMNQNYSYNDFLRFLPCKLEFRENFYIQAIDRIINFYLNTYLSIPLFPYKNSLIKCLKIKP